MNLETPIVLSPPATRVVHVCAWCPGHSVAFLKWVEAQGCQITHGICPEHKQEMLAQARKAVGV